MKNETEKYNQTGMLIQRKGYRREKQVRVVEYLKRYCVGEKPYLFHIGSKGPEFFHVA